MREGFLKPMCTGFSADFAVFKSVLVLCTDFSRFNKLRAISI